MEIALVEGDITAQRVGLRRPCVIPQGLEVVGSARVHAN